MIISYVKNQKLAKTVANSLKKNFNDFRHIILDDYSSENLTYLANNEVRVIFVEKNFSPLPEKTWLQLLENIGKRIPVIILSPPQVKTVNAPIPVSVFSENLIWIHSPKEKDISDVLSKFPLMTEHDILSKQDHIPIFEPQVPKLLMQKNGSISVITIHGTDFQKFAMEYGNKVYQQVQQVFLNILYELWGAPGSFRKSDLLFRKSPSSNTYYLFLQLNRNGTYIPAPGVAESLANRIATQIQLSLWNEVLKFGKDRRLPDCIKLTPKFSVGYATGIDNPCLGQEDIVERLIHKAGIVAKVQNKRLMERHRELMQCLIKIPDVLYSQYQGIFWLDKLTEDHMKQVEEQQSIAPLKDLVYGFEALMRIKRDKIPQDIMRNAPLYINQTSLRPDILFGLARNAEVTMELDQGCLKAAIANKSALPGKLMINILPRNLYYIDRLLDPKTIENVTFEVSESEDISNFDLIMDVKQKLKECNVGIAADDFGRGYTGLERILKVQPDVIKLDRSLVQNIHLDKPKCAFVNGLVQAASVSNALLIAEGVELWEEAKILKEMGIQLIQGFLLHKPQPVQEVLKQLDIDATANNVENEEDEALNKFGGAA